MKLRPRNKQSESVNSANCQQQQDANKVSSKKRTHKEGKSKRKTTKRKRSREIKIEVKQENHQFIQETANKSGQKESATAKKGLSRNQHNKKRHRQKITEEKATDNGIVKLQDKRRTKECTHQESVRILREFAVDGGNYKSMAKELHGIEGEKIRKHLQFLFYRSLNIIIKVVSQSGRPIRAWEKAEMREIVRELHRIRSTNRLLSEKNSEFRQKFLQLMMSYNDEHIQLTGKDFNELYRRIEAFVRGSVAIGAASKLRGTGRPTETPELMRSHLLEGGYMMSGLPRTKRIFYKQSMDLVCKQQSEEKLWTKEEEKVLGELYLKCRSSDAGQYRSGLVGLLGENERWGDEEMISRKIEELVKRGLHKLYNLTTSSSSLLQNYGQVNHQIVSSSFTPVQPNNSSGFIRDLPLLQRQILGLTQSYRVKARLVGLQTIESIDDEYLSEVIEEVRQFVADTIEWQHKNRILKVTYDQILNTQFQAPVSTRHVKDISSASETKIKMEPQDELDQQQLQSILYGAVQ